MATLTEKQRRFVQHYTGNATEAARLAGYKSPEVEGCRLLKNAKVVTVLTTRVQVSEANAGITREAKKERLQHIIEGEDDKLAMQAIDIDNKMQAEYVQRIKDETDYVGLSEDEMLLEVLNDPESREKVVKVFAALGYKVIAIT